MLLATMIVTLAEGECPQYGSLDNSCANNLPSLASPLAGGSLSQRVITGSFFGDSWPRTYCNNLPKKHVGIDLRANFNEPVYAAYDGTVTRVRPSSSWCTNWGSTIIIDHSGLFTTIYEHVDPEQQITAGSEVKKSDIIGRIAEIAKIPDRTKASDCDTVNHLHFGIRCGGDSDICLRGALPDKNGDSDYDPNTDKFTGCKCDPLFPGGFINPLDSRIIYEEPAAVGAADSEANAGSDTDSILPTVQNFQVAPQSVTTDESITIDYTVSDTGGSGLNRVELWRKDEQSDWQEIKRDALSGGDGPATGSFTDASSNAGKYWYGIHVADNAGNWNDERNSNSNNQPGGYIPVEVEIKRILPPEQKLIDNYTEITIPSRTSLKLEEGYELAIKSVDMISNKAYVELSKDGQLVDSKVVSVSKDGTTANDTYYYKKDIGNRKKVTIIAVHFRDFFQKDGHNSVTIDRVMQISDE
ncbi:MAG: hypothetical protein EHM14_06985 [Methanothrix sp.]|nr:MAG: hypothetical protein EHM14_06985 [Methanothrix sp.]